MSVSEAEKASFEGIGNDNKTDTPAFQKDFHPTLKPQRSKDAMSSLQPDITRDQIFDPK